MVDAQFRSAEKEPRAYMDIELSPKDIANFKRMTNTRIGNPERRGRAAACALQSDHCFYQDRQAPPAGDMLESCGRRLPEECGVPCP